MSFRVIHSPTKAGSMSNPDLGVFSVTFNGAVSRRADDPRATCIDPNNPSAGGDYVCVQPGVAIYGSSPGGSPPFDAFAVPQNLQSPMYHYFHASLQRELFRGNAITVSYVGSRGRDLLFLRDLNAPPLGSPFGTPQPFRPFNAQFPNLRQIISLTNDGKSWYDSLQVSFRQYGWHG